jgi:propanediol dehydratase small subunit
MAESLADVLLGKWPRSVVKGEVMEGPRQVSPVYSQQTSEYPFPEDFMKEKKFDPQIDYPLASRRPDLVKTLSGLDFSEISLENVSSGKIPPQEIRISPETLEYQARIAKAHGRFQLANNFRRAAELTRIPDEEVLKIYNALRPHQATKEDLLEIAKDIEKKYKAKINGRFIREAIEVYEKRNLLKEEHRGGENHG